MCGLHAQLASLTPEANKRAPPLGSSPAMLARQEKNEKARGGGCSDNEGPLPSDVLGCVIISGSANFGRTHTSRTTEES